MKEQPWGAMVKEDLEAGLAGHPDLELQFADPEGDAEKQVRLLEALLAARVDALIVLPIDGARVRPVLARYAAAGIPVISLDNDLEAPELYRALILADNRVFGRKMGEFFVEVSGGRVDLLELRGIPATSAAQHRSEGFREAIAASPGVRVVASVDCDWLYTRAREAVARLLPLHPEVEAVYAQNDEMARGALDAAEAAGRAGRLLITGIDALRGEQGLQLVMQGRLGATLVNPSPGRPASRAVLATLAGEPCLPRTLLQTSIIRSNERIRAWREQRPTPSPRP
jgi:ABC-type sugar transport system substrate-binding protein